MNMKQKILDYIKANPTVPASVVASKLGTKVQYVHSVKYLEGKKKSKATRRKALISPLQVEAAQKTVNTLDQIRISNLEKEIVELTTIIAYLEHRCAKAESVRGFAV